MLKNEKGITLIALIITIIVMLILVGVTINVALNGGLFTKASDAAMETEKRAILEKIIALAEWENNGKINVKATVDNVKEEFGADKVSTTPNPVANGATTAIVTITGKRGTYNYKITTREITITGAPGPEPEIPTELEKYFFNQDETTGEYTIAKSILIIPDDEYGAVTFVNDENTQEDESETIQLINIGADYAIVEYKGADYKIDVADMDTSTPETAIGTDGKNITKLNGATYAENATEDEIKIKQYFTGYSGVGKYLPNLLDMEKSEQVGSYVFKDNDIITDATNIQIVEEVEGQTTIAYNGFNYIIKVEKINYMTFVTSATREDKLLEEEWGNPENDRYYQGIYDDGTSDGQIMQFIITETNKIVVGAEMDNGAIFPLSYGHMYDSITVTVNGEEKVISNPIFIGFTVGNSQGIYTPYQITAALKDDGKIVLYDVQDDDNNIESWKDIIKYKKIEETDDFCSLIESPLKNIEETYIKQGENEYMLSVYYGIRISV